MGPGGEFVVNGKTGRPKWDAYCKECGAKAHA